MSECLAYAYGSNLRRRDVLDEIRSRAKDRHLPYQTYINQLLRNTVLGSGEDERIRRIVVEELKKVI